MFFSKNVLLFASYASSILENTTNPGDINKLEKSEETSKSSTGTAKLCIWERTTPHITLSWRAISRRAAGRKGSGGHGGCYTEREPAVFLCCREGSWCSGMPADDHSPLVSNGGAQLNAVSFSGLLSTRESSTKDHKNV